MRPVTELASGHLGPREAGSISPGPMSDRGLRRAGRQPESRGRREWRHCWFSV